MVKQDTRSSRVESADKGKSMDGDENEKAAGGDNTVKKSQIASFFIVGFYFGERFMFTGLKTILSIYLRDQLGYSENVATEIYHAFSFLSFISPITGGFLADQYLGKYKTILIMASVSVVATGIVTLGTIPGLPQAELTFIGLFLLTLGVGCSSCVSALGGDQFKLPAQSRQVQTFFLAMYFATNVGAMISGFLTPALRGDVQCLSQSTCYPLAFGVPALFIVVALAIIKGGKSWYILKPPKKSVYFSVAGCIWYAIKSKLSSKPVKGADNWLDQSVNKYGADFVRDVKSLLRVLMLLVPIPIFWALFVQMGSRWTFQASRMNGLTGYYTIKPDQIALANPLFIITLIPLFDRVIYPSLAKIGLLTKPLQRMCLGGLMAAAAFVVSGIMEMELQKSVISLPTVNHSHLHVMNALECDLRLEVAGATFLVPNRASQLVQSLTVKESPLTLVSEIQAPCDIAERTISREVKLRSKHIIGLLFWQNVENRLDTSLLSLPLDSTQTHQGDSRVRFVLVSNLSDLPKVIVSEENSDNVVNVTYTSEPVLEAGGTAWTLESDYANLLPGGYNIRFKPALIHSIGEQSVGNLSLGQDGVKTIVISVSSQGPASVTTFTLSPDASIHVLWLLPQFFLLTMGEVLLSVTGLEFAYTQAPESMKSVLQACFMATVALGNLIVIISAGASAFDDNRAGEFFFFAGLMCLDMVLFAYLAHRYKYVDTKAEESVVEEHEMK